MSAFRPQKYVANRHKAEISVNPPDWQVLTQIVGRQRSLSGAVLSGVEYAGLPILGCPRDLLRQIISDTDGTILRERMIERRQRLTDFQA